MHAHTHTHSHSDTPTHTHMPGHIQMRTKTHAHSYTWPSLPFTPSANAIFSSLHLFEHTRSFLESSGHTISSAWTLSLPLVTFLSWSQGHWLQIASLAPWATLGLLAITPVVHVSSPFKVTFSGLYYSYSTRAGLSLCSAPCPVP